MQPQEAPLTPNKGLTDTPLQGLTNLQQKALQAENCKQRALIEALRKENRRLQTVRSAERAGREEIDDQEVANLRAALGEERYKLSRLGTVLKRVGISHKGLGLSLPVQKFATDDCIEEIAKRSGNGNEEKPVAVDMKSGSCNAEEPEKMNIVDDNNNISQQRTEASAERGTNKMDTNIEKTPLQNEKETNKSGNPDEPTTRTDTQRAPISGDNMLQDTAMAEKPDVVPQQDPASKSVKELLRVLVGAQSIKLKDAAPGAVFTMANPEKGRELKFCLEWDKKEISYTKVSVKLEDAICPPFLAEEAISFEHDQAPNFLISVMGAMEDFSVVPKED